MMKSNKISLVKLLAKLDINKCRYNHQCINNNTICDCETNVMVGKAMWFSISFDFLTKYHQFKSNRTHINEGHTHLRWNFVANAYGCRIQPNNRPND